MEGIQKRISELTEIIRKSLQDTSVTSAITWANAVSERSELEKILSHEKTPK